MSDYDYEWDTKNISLEEEFSYIKDIYHLVIKTKNSTELNNIFNKVYLERYIDYWEKHPYIFDEIDEKHIYADRL